MATTRKSKTTKPTVDAVVNILFNDGGDGDDALLDAIASLEEEFDGLTVLAFVAAESDEDEEDDTEEEDEESEDDDADDADEDDDDTDEEEEEEPYTEDELADLSNDDLKELLEEYEVELDGRFSKPKAIKAILAAQDEYFGTDEDEEEDEDEDTEDDEEEIDEDALNEMGLKELKDLYEELFEEKPKPRTGRAALIEAILASADEED
jgi:hypothetical protein